MNNASTDMSETETRAALDSGCVVFHVPVDVVEVAGADAASYLQGQLSQNVDGLKVGESAFSLLLAPQGFVDAWFRLLRRDETTFWLVIDAGFGEQAKQRLERFKLRVDCEITLDEMVLSAFRGSVADEVDLAELTSEAHAKIDAVWPGTEGIDIVGPSGVAGVDTKVGSPSAFEWLRVVSGQPAMGSEITEKTIPASVGVVDMSVDFTKGCYVGQELVARVDSRGNNTPTTLHRISFADGPADVSVGDELQSSDGVAGVVTSVARSETSSAALAFIKRNVDLDTTLWVDTAKGQLRASRVHPS